MHAVNDPHPNAAKALPTAASALAGAVITALLTIMVVGVGASVLLREYRLAQRLEDNGVVVKAAVVDRREEQGESVRSYVRYRYVVPDPRGDGEQRFEAEQKVSGSSYSALQPGDGVAVVYDASDPAFSRLKGLESDWQKLLVLALVLGPIGPIFSFITLRNWLRARELDRDGVVGNATVVDLIYHKDSEGGETRHVIFRIQGCYVRQQLVDSLLFARLRHGGLVRVRYLPRDPRRARLDETLRLF